MRYLFLGLAAAGVLGMIAIRTLRKRALSETEMARWVGSHPGPLRETELDALRRWQRNMRWTALAVLFYVGVMVGVASTVPDEAWIIRWIAFMILPAIVIGGVALQFSVRCPRCSMLLGLQSSLGIPENCERCGVALRGQS